MRSPRWSWPVVNATTFGASGDLAKVFRNEEVKAPGFFSADAIPPDAALLAREAIQNAWDAAMERRRSQAPEERLPFEIRFRFFDVDGDEADALIDRLGLGELEERAAKVDNRRQLGLAERDPFSGLGQGEDLRLLEVYETTGGGMGGGWGTSSRNSGWRCAAPDSPRPPMGGVVPSATARPA
ncbi:MAG: hypothetical protein OXN44_13830 [Acidimicrobiaceae bacterium]|nr:hypothetical protein [Acidimicrobiaceae bacterium]